MKLTVLLLCALVLLTIESRAQSYPCIEPGATIVATVGNEATYTTAEGRSANVEFDMIVFRAPSGPMSTYVDSKSIRFTGDPTVVDQLPTNEIFGFVCSQSVKRMIELGYPSCPTSCDVPTQVAVIVESCVTRSGSGLSTAFSQCEPGCCTRLYSVCCPRGQSQAVITLIGSNGPGCNNLLCESTCPP